MLSASILTILSPSINTFQIVVLYAPRYKPQSHSTGRIETTDYVKCNKYFETFCVSPDVDWIMNGQHRTHT